MSVSSSGERRSPAEANPWLPSQGRYLSRLKLATLRDYLCVLFTGSPGLHLGLERGELALRDVWSARGLPGVPKRSHAYRHFLAAQLLRLVVPVPGGQGYRLAPRGESLLAIAAPGHELQQPERALLAAALFDPPPDMDSAPLALAHLVAPSAASPEAFLETGGTVVLKRKQRDELEARGRDGSILIAGEDAVDHVLRGARDLLLEVELVGEVQPPSDGCWQRVLFPVQRVLPERIEGTVIGIVEHIRSRLDDARRLPLSVFALEVRPKLQLTVADYRTLLRLVAQRYPEEYYFDRLSLPLAGGTEDHYVKIGDYWRSSIVRV